MWDAHFAFVVTVRIAHAIQTTQLKGPTMTTRILTATALLALCASIAHSQSTDFISMDADASGGLSLEEIQAVIPDVKAEDFGRHDGDASGELSVEEFAAWMATETEMNQ
ncbi:MAG: hypothetical protein DHS20C04_16100 [Hyphococcus sp.]|nr:MAG: hypothetical protein DHS20C04_16100 [Marinicaulis sp.]